MKSTVYQGEAKWGRPAYLKLIEGKVVFDCSDEEYGPIEFDIEILVEALSKHYYTKAISHDEWQKLKNNK